MARRERTQQPEEPPAGAPEWIVTFSDMVSLLVTFFVMLMSFSTMDQREAMVVLEAFAESRGGIVENEAGHSAVEPPAQDRMSAVHPARGADRPHARPDEALAESLVEMGQRDDDEHLAIDLSQVVDGLLIRFGPEAGFAPGSAEVRPALRRSLGELGRTLAPYGHLVVVEGFTDAAFAPTPQHPSPEALSAARAAAAAQAMLEASSLDPVRVQIAGLGAARPLAPDDTAGERSMNRRVEVRVLSLSKSRAARAEAERRRLDALERR